MEFYVNIVFKGKDVVELKVKHDDTLVINKKIGFAKDICSLINIMYYKYLIEDEIW